MAIGFAKMLPSFKQAKKFAKPKAGELDRAIMARRN